MSSTEPPPPADQPLLTDRPEAAGYRATTGQPVSAGPPVERARHDPGLGAERTRLAWRRTALAATLCELLIIRQAALGGGGPVALLGTALSLLCWLGLLRLAGLRIKAMATVRPVRLARLAAGLVSCCVGMAAAGVMLILA
jgi:hypothetical protein